MNDKEKFLNELVKLNVSKLDKYYKNKEVEVEDRIRVPLIIRLDGVKFGKNLREFRFPRDIQVHNALIYGLKQLMKKLNGHYGYVTSDEVNLLIMKILPHAGKYEKIISISASALSAYVSQKLNLPLYFDSRILKVDSQEDIFNYFIYRMRVGLNNYISSIYHKLIKSNKTPKLIDMLNTLQKHNIYLEKIDEWEYLGSCVIWEKFIKKGFNPIIKKVVYANRRKLSVYHGTICLQKLNKLLKLSSDDIFA